VPADGFPADYVVARVSGRRARLVTDWRQFLAAGRPSPASDEEVWAALLGEYGWLYRQMNSRLRRDLAPVLALFELKTIVLCLRNRAAQRIAEIDRLLEGSLLSENVQRALRHGTDVRSSIAELAKVLGAFMPQLAGVEAAYASEGLQGFERELNRGYLSFVMSSALHPAVRWFFQGFVDLRNVMILYKHVRWRIDGAAEFMPGGRLETSRLRVLADHKDPAALEALLAEVTGRAPEPLAVSEGTLESVLLGHMTRQLRERGRDDAPAGVILDYAWRVYAQARNLSVIAHGRQLDAALLERELVA
jgi:hypothetical protein